ncbi:MAG: ribonuclease D [Magnetococcales bacterium]|nr:ribonuclease D [Magnetococcales bacterium]
MSALRLLPFYLFARSGALTTVQTQPKVFQTDLDADYLQRYLASRYLAVDTETMGLNLHRDRLCLVQMCNEAGLVAMVQIQRQQPHGAAPHLKSLLESPNVEKIFHFARFDLAALRHWLGIDVQPFFCTKIASRLVRTYSGSHGLKDLVRELASQEMDKQQQSSDWGAERLSPQQLQYAQSDVTHLVTLKERLEEMLRRENRLELARACMHFLPTRVILDLAGWEAEDIFGHS